MWNGNLGLTPLGILDELSNSVIDNDLAKALEVVRNACAQGIEPHRLLSDFLELFRGSNQRSRHK